MPRLHPETGFAACGTAGGQVSVGARTGEQRILCEGGCTFWFNRDEIAYIGPEFGTWAAGGRVYPQRINIHTGERFPLEQVPNNKIRQANFLAAGGNRWQAAIAGSGYSYGMCGEFPGGTISRAMTDGRGAVSEDGTIALVDIYQGVNNGFRLGRPDGIITDRIAYGEDPYTLYVIDKDSAIWSRERNWGCYNVLPPLWLKGSSGRACWCEINQIVYLVHWIEGFGLVARRADSNRGKILVNTDRVYHYDAVPWNGGIRIAWVTIDGEPPGSLVIEDWDLQSDIEDLFVYIPDAIIPTFGFLHPVIIAPFKDPENKSGATHEIVVNQTGQSSSRPHFAAEDSLSGGRGELLGIYSESIDPSRPLEIASSLNTRLLLAHDSPSLWMIPRGLRKWDIPVIELYLVKGETTAQSIARWKKEMYSLLTQWPGDLGVIPMFYAQGGAPPDDELWNMAEVCDAIRPLSEIVNISPRIKVIAPFSYLRANGIVGHVELRQAFENLKFAAMVAGLAQLIPIPKPPDPPKPDPKFELFYRPKEYTMSGTEVGAIKGPGNKFGRVLQFDSGAGPFGWYPVLFDRDSPDDDCWFELSKPDSRYSIRHLKIDGLFGADSTENSDSIPRQFYLKPGNDRGILESPILIHDPASELIVGYFTWPEKTLAGPAFAWVKR